MGQDITEAARRDAQSVEIAFALFVGVAVFVGLVVPAAILANAIDLDGPGWERAGQVGVMVAAVVALASLLSVVVRARRRGL